MRYVLLGTLTLIGACLPSGARAQSNTVAVTYGPGWNMLGGPAGTDFSTAGNLYTYGSGGYAVLNSTIATTCQGYWAYLTRQVTLSLSAAPSESSQSCPVQSGWNLIGNPFAGIAQLPSGTPAYHWSPDEGAYIAASSIPVGGADWVYSYTAGSVLLQLAGPAGTNLVIQGFGNLGPYQVHVGDTVTLIVPTDLRVSASATSSLLQLESTRDEPDGHFWTWRAIAPGRATIGLVLLCPEPENACDPARVLRIEVDISP